MSRARLELTVLEDRSLPAALAAPLAEPDPTAPTQEGGERAVLAPPFLYSAPGSESGTPGEAASPGQVIPPTGEGPPSLPTSPGGDGHGDDPLPAGWDAVDLAFVDEDGALPSSGQRSVPQVALFDPAALSPFSSSVPLAHRPERPGTLGLSGGTASPPSGPTPGLDAILPVSDNIDKLSAPLDASESVPAAPPAPPAEGESEEEPLPVSEGKPRSESGESLAA